jgi:hypothetical protein
LCLGFLFKIKEIKSAIRILTKAIHWFLRSNSVMRERLKMLLWLSSASNCDLVRIPNDFQLER